MKRFGLIAMVAGLLWAGHADAQLIPGETVPPYGTVMAVTDTKVTLIQEDGVIKVVDLLPNRTVEILERGTVDQIPIGSFVRTENNTRPDGSGTVVAISVFSPTTHRFNQNDPMSLEGAAFWTDGEVTKVVKAGDGVRLTVDYGAGTRQLFVPPTALIRVFTEASRDLVRPGLKITIILYPDKGPPTQEGILIAKTDLPK